jgi:TolB-like protein
MATAAVGALIMAALIYWQFYRSSRYVPSPGGRALLAVATLESINPDLERVAFTKGFVDTLAGEIAKLDSVQLISPSTVRRYERWGIPTSVMGRVLGLDVILEGMVQQSESQVRIWIRMSDVHSGRLIWAESYDCPAGDLATAPSKVARAVREQVSQRLKH